MIKEKVTLGREKSEESEGEKVKWSKEKNSLLFNFYKILCKSKNSENSQNSNKGQKKSKFTRKRSPKFIPKKLSKVTRKSSSKVVVNHSRKLKQTTIQNVVRVEGKSLTSHFNQTKGKFKKSSEKLKKKEKKIQRQNKFTFKKNFLKRQLKSMLSQHEKSDLKVATEYNKNKAETASLRNNKRLKVAGRKTQSQYDFWVCVSREPRETMKMTVRVTGVFGQLTIRLPPDSVCQQVNNTVLEKMRPNPRPANCQTSGTSGTNGTVNPRHNSGATPTWTGEVDVASCYANHKEEKKEKKLEKMMRGKRRKYDAEDFQRELIRKDEEAAAKILKLKMRKKEKDSGATDYPLEEVNDIDFERKNEEQKAMEREQEELREFEYLELWYSVWNEDETNDDLNDGKGEKQKEKQNVEQDEHDEQDKHEEQDIEQAEQDLIADLQEKEYCSGNA